MFVDHLSRIVVVALVGVGVWFVLTSRTPKVTEKQIVLAPQLGPDGFGVTLGGLL